MKDYVSPEVYFAQHLASNDTKIRNRAVKKLRAWLTMRSISSLDFTEDDMLKIWKGLFYCMWMCDKPLNQENLADNISGLVHCFPNPKLCMRFIDTFFQSMSKEWHGIDRYRIEKFMLLVRRFLCQCFCVLSNQQWKPKFVLKLLKVLKKRVVNPQRDDHTPPGLKMHVMDVYLDELAKAGGCELKPKKFIKLLKPYVTFLAVSEESLQLNAVVKEIFHPLIWQAFHQEDNEQEEEDEDDEKTVTFQVDFNALADLLLKHATSEERQLLSRNQKLVYKLVAQLRTAARGEFPFHHVDSDDDNEDYKLKKKDINKAARELVADELKIAEERKERIMALRERRRLKKKRIDEEEKRDDSDVELFDGELETLTGFQENEPERKRKRRKKGPAKRKSQGTKGGKINKKMKPVKVPRKKKLHKR